MHERNENAFTLGEPLRLSALSPFVHGLQIARSPCDCRIGIGLALTMIRADVAQASDHHLERPRIDGVREGVVGVDKAIEPEAMGDEELRVDLMRS